MYLHKTIKESRVIAQTCLFVLLVFLSVGTLGFDSYSTFPTSNANRWDVIVTPPGGDFGTLRVNGDAGAAAVSILRIYLCKKDATGAWMQGGCSALQDANLNDPISLHAGAYIVALGGSWTKVEIQPKKTTIIDLQKIKFATSPLNYQWGVFWDLTNLAMQNQLAESSWLDESYKIRAEAICRGARRATPANAAFCSAWQSNDLQIFKNFAYKFEKDATYSAMQLRLSGDVEPLAMNRMLISVTGTSKDFISVFPGTYGAVFQYPDGHQDVTYGIVVK